MSRCIDIFVQSEVLLEDLLGTLENLLSIKLHKMELNAEIWHEYISEHILISFGHHSFENDRDMDFENYRYDITIRSINMYDPMRSDNVRRRFAWRIYSMLRALDKYDLMMVENVQTKMAEFHVAHSNNRSVIE